METTLAYKYEFDYRTVPFLRGDYELAKKALYLLRSEVQAWNEKALNHGALSVPFDREIQDLDFIIQQFEGVQAPMLLTGVAIGTLRYLKAGLILLAARKEEDISDKVKEGWPDTVLESMREGLHQVNSFSNMLEVEPAGILNEVVVSLGKKRSVDALEWDVFISYASEDREDFVQPLAERLHVEGLRVWYADFVLKVGDSLNRSIDSGLARSKFGIAVISPNFLAKEWPRRELDGLVTREVDGTKVILPVWHNIEYEQLRTRSPMLADRIAVKSSEGLDRVVDRLLEVLRPSQSA